jgi:hypothetical protein
MVRPEQVGLYEDGDASQPRAIPRSIDEQGGADKRGAEAPQRRRGRLCNRREHPERPRRAPLDVDFSGPKSPPPRHPAGG